MYNKLILYARVSLLRNLVTIPVQGVLAPLVFGLGQVN